MLQNQQHSTWVVLGMKCICPFQHTMQKQKLNKNNRETDRTRPTQRQTDRGRLREREWWEWLWTPSDRNSCYPSAGPLQIWKDSVDKMYQMTCRKLPSDKQLRLPGSFKSANPSGWKSDKSVRATISRAQNKDRNRQTCVQAKCQTKRECKM